MEAFYLQYPIVQDHSQIYTTMISVYSRRYWQFPLAREGRAHACMGRNRETYLPTYLSTSLPLYLSTSLPPYLSTSLPALVPPIDVPSLEASRLKSNEASIKFILQSHDIEAPRILLTKKGPKKKSPRRKTPQPPNPNSKTPPSSQKRKKKKEKKFSSVKHASKTRTMENDRWI